MTVDSIAKNQMSSAMIKLASMKRINTAADDAAGLAIAEKLDTQVRGLEKGIDNTLDMKNLVTTAEGGLSTIHDSLQRIRELSVQAANGIYTDDDKKLIQQEIVQLKEHINGVTQQTQFNNMNLLDGTFVNKHTASSADGSGPNISIPAMDTLTLGIKNFDVTKDFNINDIDSAISNVSSARSYLGAMANRLDYNVSSNSISMLNQAAAKSRILDLDVAKGVADVNRDRILNEAQIYSQKRAMEQMSNGLSLLL